MTLLHLKIELVGHCEIQGPAKLMAANFVDSSFSVTLTGFSQKKAGKSANNYPL